MITLYCPQISSRIKYVFEFVFRDVLMVDYIIISDQIQIKGPVINYSTEKLNIKNFQIYPTAFLKSKDLNFSNYVSYDSNAGCGRSGGRSRANHSDVQAISNR